ncbi:MAG: COG1470 family protein, partial [Candidatus Hodarchaeales archaeon]
MIRTAKKFSIFPVFIVLMIITTFSLAGVVSTPLTVVWSDDFSDGNLDGWTIQGGDYTVANEMLQAAGGISYNFWGDFNRITHPSSIAYGTWSFDIELNTTTIISTEYCSVYFAMKTLLWGQDGIYTEHGYYLTISPDLSEFMHTFSPGFQLVYQHPEVTEKPLGDYGGLHILPNGLPTVFHIDITRDTDGHFNLFMNGTLIVEAMDNTETTSTVFGFQSEDGYALDNITIDDSIVIWPNPADRANLLCLEDSLDLTCESGSTASTEFTIQNNGQASGYSKLIVTPSVSGLTPFFVGSEMITLVKGAAQDVVMGIRTTDSVSPGDYEFTVELWNSSTMLDTLQLNLTVTEKATQTTTTTTTESSPSF